MCEENHIVKRAIIMAAGFGNRMHPLTLTTPKPLVKVNGVRMIDTVVDGLRSNGITEIYVVVGHLKEQFYSGLRSGRPSGRRKRRANVRRSSPEYRSLRTRTTRHATISVRCMWRGSIWGSALFWTGIRLFIIRRS